MEPDPKPVPLGLFAPNYTVMTAQWNWLVCGTEMPVSGDPA